ncbi:hypothetical protein V501_01013 [Pseudogymnoascus sp. VKM F-4519 (FW-2642)]|nr:hypothetical protein V501_01013 [Pseudogymnoascus sp. VKM F-4519 (FW-2642)]
MRFLSYAATFLELFAGVYASLATFDPNNPDGVYSCEYQLTAATFLSATDMPNTFIPFYPPPEGGGGACSCNLGHVYENLTYVDITGGIQRLLQISRDQSSDSTDQCAVISSNPSLCTETFGFDYVNDTVLNPFNLPAGKPGTEPISNLPGNAFTEVDADKITMSVFGYTTTITPAKWNTNAGAVTGTSRGGAAATGTAGSGSGTQTSTAAGAGKTNAAAVLGAQRVLVGGVVAGIVGLGML